ncbi:MAG: rhodanese-like domain-containing protein [Omnitrophica WOR_2 bacterium]
MPNLLHFVSLWWLPLGKAPEITPDELHQKLVEHHDVQLVDARTRIEYEQGTLAAARYAPVTGLPGSIDRLHLDPERPVVVLCATGHRSLPGTRLLRSRGYQAYSLKGGVGAWKRAGYALQKPGEQVN